MRKCSRCHNTKPVSEFGGPNKVCSNCRVDVKHYLANRVEKIKDGMIKCSRCHLQKSTAEFDDGKKVCIDCRSSWVKYYKLNRRQCIDKVLKRSKKKENRPHINEMKRALIRKNPANYLLTMARCKAKKRGIAFNLSIEDIVIPKRCPVLGIELHINDGVCADNSISLDKIIPSLGYTKGNVCVISHKANTIKNNATIDDLKLAIKYIESRLIKHQTSQAES